MAAFREIRRKDRIWDNESARELLEKSEYGILSVCAPEGYGYGIPLNYILEGDSLYFHCAPEGHKLDAVRTNDRVSFCVVGNTQVIPGKFTTNYASVIVFGHMTIVENDEERLHALRLLVGKYSADFREVSERYIAGSFGRTAILRLDIEHLSGKTKKATPQPM